ncbi:MAG TPA: VOC family protein [Ktedonobacteraceae bacterium]|jgi:predicted enzyme related to lactoylglutathione lyase
MSNNIGISGPGFISFQVRDLAAAAAFYEQTIGLKRDPRPFPGAVAFLSTPIPFGLLEKRPEVDLDNLPLPGLGTALWLKAENGQVAYDALKNAGVSMVRDIFDGPFGKTFTFSDLDGYRVTIYDRDLPPL